MAKKLKDITKEQAIEIAKLIYPFSNELPGTKETGIKSDFEFKYQPYDATWYEDAREFIRVSFKGITFGETVDNLIMEINKNLDCHLYYSRKDGLHSIGCTNQYAIQKKFIEWEIEPEYTK